MNLVEQIYDSLTTVVTGVVGSEYKFMRRIFQPDLNDLRNAKKAYAVRHLSAADASSETRHYTLDHGFEVMLMQTIVDRGDDRETQSTINELYDLADDVIRTVFLQKAGLPSIVMIVNRPSISEPEIIGGDCVLLRISFNVKYKNEVVY